MLRPKCSFDPGNLGAKNGPRATIRALISCLLLFQFAVAVSPGPREAPALSPADELRSTLAPSLFAEGSWGLSSPLSLARQDFQALVLPNGPLKGKILAVGGCCSAGSSLASAEVFNPQDSSWHTAGDLLSPRWLFQAVTLKNGSALAIGGLSIAKGGVLNSTEMFIPSTDGSINGTWSSVADMNTPRQDFQALLLDDGTVLAVGGFMASTEIYDSQKDVWSQNSAMSMRTARSAFEMVRLRDGSVLAVGGRGRVSNVLSSAEVFDPVTRTWGKQSKLIQGRVSFALVPLPDGRWMAAGGMSDAKTILNTTEIYDPETVSWTQGPDMVYHRTQQQAVSLPSGRLLMVGGLGGLDEADVNILDTAEIFDPASNEWSLIDPMVNARYVFQMVQLPNGTAMAIGGTGVKGFTSSTEVFQTL